MKRHTDKRIMSCECLDLVEASHRRRVYPLMYCRMELAGHLDIERLKQAVSLSSKIVPEILYSFNFQRGCFIDSGHTADDVVIPDMAVSLPLLQPDLSKHPQLRIIISSQLERNQVIAAMSHILADGDGFLQYLYLLASLYSGSQADKELKNERDIRFLLKNIQVLAPTEQTKQNRHVSVPPLRSSGKDNYPFCLTVQITADNMTLIRQKAKQSGATLNDVFMTAYARVIARLQNMDTVSFPCPANLRLFFPQAPKLTVANMTGIYRKIAVEIEHGCTFSSTLQQVHIEMSLQKARYHCFSGIEALYKAYRRIPRLILKQIIKTSYRLLPVSYTNIGVISDTMLHFKDCTVQSCFFTGTYRLPPDFQLAVSTFRNISTLTCTLLGSLDDMKNGQYILEQVKHEILEWLESS